jgi:hypothetical protein
LLLGHGIKLLLLTNRKIEMIEQYENEIKKLEKLLTKFYGNTSSVKMKKYAIEKKIAKYQDIVDEMNLILAI